MKKIFAMLFLSLFLVSCFGNKEEIKKSTWSWTWVLVEEKKEIWKVDKTIYWETEEEKAYRIEEKENRVKILPNEISDIYLWKISEKKFEENPVLKNWVDFINWLKKSFDTKITENINWWIEFSEYEKNILKSNKDFIREFDLLLDIKDFETNEKIKNWFVYLNNIKFWEFKDWKFEKKFKWPLWIEKFVIMVRVDWYWDSFLNLNSLNNDWNLIYWELNLKKILDKKVKLWEKIEIWNLEKENYSIEIPECALVNIEGNCYRWEVRVISNHISWEDVNNGKTTLNMVWIDDNWKYWDLFSWWMAFNDFITPTWEILKIWEWKKIKVTYKLSDELMISFSDLWTSSWNEGKNAYWIYDKNDMIWKLSKDIPRLDKEKNLWIVETSDIY